MKKMLLLFICALFTAVSAFSADRNPLRTASSSGDNSRKSSQTSSSASASESSRSVRTAAPSTASSSQPQRSSSASASAAVKTQNSNETYSSRRNAAAPASNQQRTTSRNAPAKTADRTSTRYSTRNANVKTRANNAVVVNKTVTDRRSPAAASSTRQAASDRHSSDRRSPDRHSSNRQAASTRHSSDRQPSVSRQPNHNTANVKTNRPHVSASHYRPARGHSNPVNSIFKVLFFPFSLAFDHSRRSHVRWNYYPHYRYYHSYLYYDYWWSAPVVYNTYTTYSYVEQQQPQAYVTKTLNDGGADAYSEQDFDLSDIKLQNARFISNPNGIALTVNNNSQYVISEIAFIFTLRGTDFTQTISNVYYKFDSPLQPYEKRFCRVDLSSAEIELPQSFAVVAAADSITTDSGNTIYQTGQNSDYQE